MVAASEMYLQIANLCWWYLPGPTPFEVRNCLEWVMMSSICALTFGSLNIGSQILGRFMFQDLHYLSCGKWAPNPNASEQLPRDDKVMVRQERGSKSEFWFAQTIKNNERLQATRRTMTSSLPQLTTRLVALYHSDDRLCRYVPDAAYTIYSLHLVLPDVKDNHDYLLQLVCAVNLVIISTQVSVSSSEKLTTNSNVQIKE